VTDLLCMSELLSKREEARVQARPGYGTSPVAVGWHGEPHLQHGPSRARGNVPDYQLPRRWRSGAIRQYTDSSNRRRDVGVAQEFLDIFGVDTLDGQECGSGVA
jgi:hypothetical protein